MNLSIAAVLATLAALAALTEANEHRAAPSVRDNHSRFATRQAQALSPRLLSAGARIGGQGTWFNVEENEVDCGGFYKSSDFVVALNQPMYGNLNAKSPFCDRWITVYANGKSAKAKIVDACPESSDACHHGSLDMSQGLFKYFAGLDVGVIDIHWTMDDGTSGDGEVGGHGHGGGEHNTPAPAAATQHQPDTTKPSKPSTPKPIKESGDTKGSITSTTTPAPKHPSSGSNEKPKPIDTHPKKNTTSTNTTGPKGAGAGHKDKEPVHPDKAEGTLPKTDVGQTNLLTMVDLEHSFVRIVTVAHTS
ncbi:hypothetical protein OC845_004576 [Tilletia horrida]|nr:hypothetical protein OC845_004576 [Tilletia horrida]